MKPKLTWILIGISTFSIVLGCLIGASNSPVLGAALSSLFGIGVALIGLINKEKNESIKLNLENLGLIGKILFLFSIFLVMGVLAGENYRNDNISFLKEKQSFPWIESPPQNTYEALDWIVVAQKLKQLGYSMNQIERVYEIRSNEISQKEASIENSIGPTEEEINLGYINEEQVYDENFPFHSVIPDELIKSVNLKARGPASKGIAK